jgi:acetyltransferase-like isoleucine patch superfamily enzyme
MLVIAFSRVGYKINPISIKLIRGYVLQRKLREKYTQNESYSMKRHLFSHYMYLENLVFALLEICPPLIRILFFKILFKSFGKNSQIDYQTYFRYAFKVSIGTNTWINRGTQFYPSHYVKEATITIGDNVLIGPNVRLFAAGHDYNQRHFKDTGAPIVVQNNVWIGGNAVILPGVTLGEGCVIGAGSVVTKSVEPYTFAVGNPARPLKERTLTDPTR